MKEKNYRVKNMQGFLHVIQMTLYLNLYVSDIFQFVWMLYFFMYHFL